MSTQVNTATNVIGLYALCPRRPDQLDNSLQTVAGQCRGLREWLAANVSGTRLRRLHRRLNGTDLPGRNLYVADTKG